MNTTSSQQAWSSGSIRVLVVDDSALMRKLLVEFLSQDSQIEVVGAAPDPFIARDMIKALNPHVLTLDVEMPRMDGLTFLENLMRLRPMPVVMVSSLTERGAEVTLQALELGAVDFVTKPKIDLEAGIRQYAGELILKIKAAATARVRGPVEIRAKAVVQRRLFRTTERIIAIGASTGGTEAIKEVLERMPADAPAMLITQHIPAAFSTPFAARMNRASAMNVREARDGEQIVPGHAYIAPGDWHLRLARDGARYVCRLDQAAPENRHRPSVDVLLRSVAQHAGGNAIGAILTGMGEDGARGLLAMREAGARCVVQDEASSVVWGMPGAAWKLGAAEHAVDIAQMADRLLGLCAGEGASRPRSAA
jgi:two-component system chemotaxis response regulator CheB